jgi:hypothetical protein
MPDRSEAMTRAKRDILVFQVGGSAWLQPHPIKMCFVEKRLKIKEAQGPPRIVMPEAEEGNKTVLRRLTKIHKYNVNRPN